MLSKSCLMFYKEGNYSWAIYQNWSTQLMQNAFSPNQNAKIIFKNSKHSFFSSCFYVMVNISNRYCFELEKSICNGACLSSL